MGRPQLSSLSLWLSLGCPLAALIELLRAPFPSGVWHRGHWRRLRGGVSPSVLEPGSSSSSRPFLPTHCF